MDSQIGILHLSDVHAQNSSKTTIAKLTKLLLNDLTQIQPKYNTIINAICIGGDLINSGDNSDIELDIVLTELIQPLMNALGLDETHFFTRR